MKRFLITVEYNGSNYLGWQKNNDDKTICSEIENAIKNVTNTPIKVVASGRTDRGVHALNQCCHIDLPDEYAENPKAFLKSVNDILPKDIVIKSIKEVSSKFHARYNVKSKTYLYRCYTSSVRSPLKSEYYGHYPAVINLEKIKSASSLFVGKHNFKGFCLADGDNTTFEREIIKIDIVRHGEEILFYIKGKGFLYSMVRLIVGTLLKAGEGKISQEQIKEALISGSKENIGIKMPASGLYLYNVEY